MSAIDTAVAAVLAEHSLADTEEVRAGVTRVADRWTDADGDELYERARAIVAG